jgi:hypothetical protein
MPVKRYFIRSSLLTYGTLDGFTMMVLGRQFKTVPRVSMMGAVAGYAPTRVENARTAITATPVKRYFMLTLLPVKNRRTFNR